MGAKEAAQNVYECFGKGDLAGVLSALTEDVTWYLVGPQQIPYFGRYRGKADVERFFALLFEHEEILEFSPESFISEGDRVVVTGRERCRARRTGKEFSVQWVQLFQVENGKISGFTEYIDTYPMVEAYR